MKTIKKLDPLFLFIWFCITLIVAIVCGTLLLIANDQLGQATIAGNAYLDYGTIRAYDSFEPPVAGFVIQLYKVGEQLPVQETRVDEKGRYEFTIVEPGVYRVQAAYSIEGYPSWDYITTLRYYGDIVVKKGQSYDGPIFLAGEYPGEEYGGLR